MIQEDYVSFETAKLLKDKGFDVECSCYYFFKDEAHFEESLSHWNWNNGYTFRYSAPTLQMAMKWLREVHKLHIWIANKLKQSKGLPWYYEIHNIETGTVAKIGDVICGSYEVACEAAIQYSLENLI